jgi:putative ABC transport system permease protein
MPFWKIAWRNIEQRALASSLTALSMALGVAVMIAVIVIHSVAVRQFSQDAQGYHLIVGGKGGELQLVLSTVYHLGQPLYPIPYTYYQKFTEGEFAGITKVAIPLCLGDSYASPNGRMFRVVGTTPDLFGKIQYGAYSDGTPKRYEFQPGGRNFKAENFYEAVVGSVVAAQSGLQVGDEINPTHGIGAEGHKHDGFQVVGILKPTGTANDRAVFINIEGFYLLEGHSLSPHDEDAHGEHEHEHETAETAADHTHEAAADEPTAEVAAAEEPAAEHLHADEESGHADHDHAEHADADHDHAHHEPLPIDQREVTSILVLCNNELGPVVLDTAVNKGEDHIAQAVAPSREVTRLLENIVGPIQLVLLVLTILIVIVAAISILVSIYNSMSERSHDIAVMRALGASRQSVMTIVLLESILLSLLGGIAGVVLGHALLGLASPYVEARTGVTLGLFEFDAQEIILIPALVVLASIVGFLPAVSAYRTDVAKALAGSR